MILQNGNLIVSVFRNFEIFFNTQNASDPQLLESQAKEIAQIATQSELEIKELTEAIRLVAKQCEEYREKLKDCESYDASEIKIEL